jgi:hypothetical protein
MGLNSIKILGGAMPPEQNDASKQESNNNEPKVFSPPPNFTTDIPPQNSNRSAPIEANSPKKQGKKWLLLLVLSLIVGGTVAAYIAFFKQESPQGLWNSALSNTAKGYDRLVDYLETENKLTDSKGLKVTGDFKVEGQAFVDGSFDLLSYQNNSKFNWDIGFGGGRIKLEGRTVGKDGEYPDAYLKISGVSGLGNLLGGQSDIGTLVNSIDNQWLAIDHTFFDQLQLQQTGETSEDKNFNKKDLIEILKAIGELNRDYLLSNSSDNRVLEVAKFVGYEDRNDRSTYHYKVTFNKENLKQYVKALEVRLRQTRLIKLLGEKAYNQYFEELNNSIDQAEMNDDNSLDVWVDTKTELVRFVRFVEQDQPANFIEFGLLYDGGDNYPFSIEISAPDDSTPTRGILKTTLSSDHDRVDFDIDFDFGENDSVNKLTSNFSVEPNNEQVNVEVPKNAISILELMGTLFGELSINSDSESSVSLLSNPILR